MVVEWESGRMPSEGRIGRGLLRMVLGLAVIAVISTLAEGD